MGLFQAQARGKPPYLRALMYFSIAANWLAPVLKISPLTLTNISSFATHRGLNPRNSYDFMRICA